jgi:hypothetical protein
MGAAVAAVVMMKERQIVEAFQRVRATSPETARPLDTFDVDTDGVGMRRLRDRAVIREAHPGHFYLDVEVWQAVRRQRRRLALVMFIIVAAAAFMGIFAIQR